MPAAPSSISSLFPWLIVSVLLLAGGPDVRQSVDSKTSSAQSAATQALAKEFAPLDLAQPNASAQPPLFKVRDLVDPRSHALLVVSGLVCVWQLLPLGADRFVARRLNLVGVVELRI